MPTIIKTMAIFDLILPFPIGIIPNIPPNEKNINPDMNILMGFVSMFSLFVL